MSGKSAKQDRQNERELVMINIAGMALAKEIPYKKRIKGIVGLLVNKGIISLRDYKPSEELLNDRENESRGIQETENPGDEKTGSKK